MVVFAIITVTIDDQPWNIVAFNLINCPRNNFTDPIDSISNARLLFVPRRKDITEEFAQGFDGMTTEPVLLNEFLAAREEMIASVAGEMPSEHKQFLLGFKSGKPDWNLLGVPGAADLPAVRWKQLNLDKLDDKVRASFVRQLTDVLLGKKQWMMITADRRKLFHDNAERFYRI
jgi:hypothetical protein